MTIEAILEQARQIASDAKAARMVTARPAKPIRQLASNCDEASAMANRTRAPVDFMQGARQCTIWPVGMTPPL
jgi:hypothetical protein